MGVQKETEREREQARHNTIIVLYYQICVFIFKE